MFTVTIRDTETNELHVSEHETEREAVSVYLSARLYDNTEPVSVTPEPNWPQYHWTTGTPVTP